MAIQVEQDKKSTNWVVVGSVIVIVLVIFAGAYFLFFKQPQLIDDVSAPSEFQDIRNIADIELGAEELLNSSRFRMLRRFRTDTSTPTPGRSNPFAPYQPPAP